LVWDSIGDKPSLGDVIKMVHPKPIDDGHKAIYAYLIGKEVPRDQLPKELQLYEALKAKEEVTETPNIPLQMLSSLPLTTKHWIDIAKRGGWTQTRINLSNYARHGVFQDKDATNAVVKILKDPVAIQKAKVMPHQVYAAYLALKEETGRAAAKVKGEDQKVPVKVIDSLHDALELSAQNSPSFEGKTILVFVDKSGSMSSPITGQRGGGTTSINCNDAASLFAALLFKSNENTKIWLFDTTVQPINRQLDRKDTILTNASKIRGQGGGTDCSAPLFRANAEGVKADVILYISDSESWVDDLRNTNSKRLFGTSTGTVAEWKAFKKNNPEAKLILWDLQPYGTSQAPNSKSEIANIGGWSDASFELIEQFINGQMKEHQWVDEVEKTELP
jgi:60 kDa SS-A/Ro ribonucleoprotein